jgi:hypothetical protein
MGRLLEPEGMNDNYRKIVHMEKGIVVWHYYPMILNLSKIS